MKPFLREQKLFITPLSPIHIGSGRDIDPTDYVVSDGLLYGFNPSDGVLNNKQKKELSRLAQRGDILAIQRFFKNSADHFIPFAQFVAPVCAGFGKEYDNNVGKVRQVSEGSQVYNQFFIGRHITMGLDQKAGVPGSSFKGAARTAWLDLILSEQKGNFQVERNERVEQRLVGEFSESPFRLLKIADFMPTDEPLTEILYSVVWYKHKGPHSAQNSGITERLECLSMGQYRGLQGSVTLPAIPQHKARRAVGKGNRAMTPRGEFLDRNGAFDFDLLAQCCNTFYGNLLRTELQYLKSSEGKGNREWCAGIEELLFSPTSTLREKIRNQQAFLIRLGANLGRDSITYRDSLRRRIKIKNISKKVEQNYMAAPRTKTLAASNNRAQEGFLPFGWAVVEIDPAEDCNDLHQWCGQAHVAGQRVADLREQLQKHRQQLETQRVALVAQVEKQDQAEKAKHEQAQRDAERQRIEAEQKAKAEAERLAAMTENERELEDFRKACEDWAAQLPPHGRFRKQNANPGEEGLYQRANRLVKAALADDGWAVDERLLLASTIEEWLPQVVSPWDARKERRRLKLNKLREQ